MKRIGTWMASCVVALAFTGCDEGRMTITLMDGGADSGSGGGTDSGSMSMPDSGSMAACSVAGQPGFPALPAACLPRCAAATTTCLMGCGANAACQETCFMNDTTPGTNLDLGGGMTQMINCSDCFIWQVNHCVVTSCEAQALACVSCADQCDPDTPGCEEQEGMLDDCLTANMTAIQTCVNTQVMRCLTPPGGFLPTLEPQIHQFYLDRAAAAIRHIPPGYLH